MDPVSAGRQTAESITNFGLLVVLASICIVGSGIAIGFLVRLAYSNYRKLESKTDEQQKEIDTLKNGARTALEKQLRLNTRVIHEFCRVILNCPNSKRLDPAKMANLDSDDDPELTPV